jgi:hypothetical protein
MTKLTKSKAKKNTTNTGRTILLPFGAQKRIADKIGTSKSYVSTILARYKKGEELRGTQELKIIKEVLSEASKLKEELDALAL